MVKNIQGTVYEQFKGKGDIPRFLLRLFHQETVEIRHNRNLSFLTFCNIYVHFPYAPVNDGLLPGIQALPYALFAKPQHKLTFSPYHPPAVIPVEAIHIHIKRIDIVSRIGTHIYHGSTVGIGNVKVFVHRINDNNLIPATEENIAHFHLTEKGFARAGNPEHKPIPVNQFFPVSDIDISANLVDSIIIASPVI